MQKQINSFIASYLSNFLCGCRQGFSTRHDLIKLVESWGLMYLSKAFDTINHRILIANLHAYGFYKESIKLFQTIFLTDGEEQRFLIV